MALSLCAVSRQPPSRGGICGVGSPRTCGYAVLLSALWLPTLLYFVMNPRAVDRRRRR